jgi:Zn-dependent protease
MFGDDFIEKALIGFPVIIFSLTVHEYFHAWTAMKFGDNTAKDMGRLTLNPIAHMDFMGLMVMIISQFQFGWAKPVPVNPFNLRDPRKADFWISFAGPLSNIGLAIISALVLKIIASMFNSIDPYFINVLQSGVIINLTLAFFNLIPLFPLDGSHMLRDILPVEYEMKISQFDRFAPMVLIFLVITGSLWYIIGPFIIFFARLLLG